MIRFNCHCGRGLQVPQSLAGQSVQCPACGLLASVPELEDLPNLEVDGTFTLSDSQWRERQTVSPPSDEVPPLASTGRPVPPKRVLPYAHRRPGPAPTPYTPERWVRWWSLPLELFQPANASVLGIVLLIHFVAQLIALAAMAGVFPFWILVGAIGFFLVCHFGNILDDTGPEGRDELPAVLRNMDLEDDLLRPLLSLLLAAALCFSPAAVLSRLVWSNPLEGDPGTLTVLGALLILGFVTFPTVWLTTGTSGIYLNLSPPRLLGTFAAAPLPLLLAIPLLPMAAVMYGASLALLYEFNRTFAPSPGILPVSLPRWLLAFSGYGLLCVSLYLWHLLPWLLGKIYQDRHEQFPWVWQRHVRGAKPAATRKVPRFAPGGSSRG